MIASPNSRREQDGEFTAATARNKPCATGMIHVLTVGPLERSCWIHDALLQEPQIWLSIAPDYKELWSRSREEAVQVFVLCETLAQSELEEASRLIRQRWPRARILAIRGEEESSDDPPYDKRLGPEVGSQELMLVIDRLGTEERE